VTRVGRFDSGGGDDDGTLPHNTGDQVFREPWQAQAFALAVSLHERGLFSWKEWTVALGDEIRKAQAAGDPDTGETYYHHWLAALESIVAAKGLADGQTLARTRSAWRHACARTPHGTPIALEAGDFADF
jgi:nitrile hydratase accessory protein